MKKPRTTKQAQPDPIRPVRLPILAEVMAGACTTGQHVPPVKIT